MIRNGLVLTVFFVMLAASAYTAEVAGVNMPDSLKIGGYDLMLNGAGKRSKFFIDAYVIGLYLQQKSKDAAYIINSDDPIAARIHITSSLVTDDKMKEAISEGFENSTGGNTGPLQDRITAFMYTFSQISENDVFEFFYVPATGLKVYKNGTQVALIEGLDFKKAFFGIWLCDKPAHEGLKKSLLGK